MKRSLTLLLPVLAAVAIFTNTVVPVEASFPFRQPRRRFGTTNIATLTKRYPRRRHHHQQQQHLDADDFIDTVSTTSQQSAASDGPVPSHHGVSVGSGIERPQRKRRRRSSTARPYTIRNRSRPNENGLSWVSRLTLFNIFMFGLQMYRPGVTQWGIKLSERIRNGEELYRLITPVFLHSNPGHLMSNTVSLLRLGPEVERFFGPGRFVATYLASGIVGNYISALRTPNPSLGASGAVFGVFGAYMAFMARHEFLMGTNGQRGFDRVAEMVGYNLLLGFLSSGIDNWAHLGGFVGGVAAATLIGPNLGLYEVPGSYGQAILVDAPLIRAPAYFERIPTMVSNQVGKLTNGIITTLRPGTKERQTNVPRTGETNGSNPSRSSKPWQRSRSIYRQRQQRGLPNRSIRPSINRSR